MASVTSRDVQQIVSKLSSDKPKAREEGIKLLNTWLEGERSISFCKYIGRNTALLKPNEIPHAETWPFLIPLLIKCVSLEVSASKRRSPKLLFAKTLRIVVHRAEDTKFSGKNLLILSVVKVLFNHIWDVLKDDASSQDDLSFQHEYGIILRHLLEVRHYQFHMTKRVYCSLVRLYMGKVETSLSAESSGQLNPKEDPIEKKKSPKEDVFRSILTLHSLLDNPPGDFPDVLREDIVNGFVGIFSHVRGEGKTSRKLVECINTYLLKDGPNLGCQSLEIHDAAQQFVFRCWITTHDRGLKDALVLYARLQLNLTRGAADGSAILEQLLDVICKELDQFNASSTNSTWSDTTRDDKCGTLTRSQCHLVELAALAFCRACVNTSRAPSAEKRSRREHAASHLKERLMKGKWLWNAAFCCLIRNYSTRISKDLFIHWFEGISASFERIINDANTDHAYDGLLWTLRSLQGLSSVLLHPVSGVEISTRSSSSLNELDKGWHTIWSCLMRGLPTFSNITSVADAALTLLGNITLSDTMNTFIVSQDVWDLRLFKTLPSMSLLCFISCYFSRRGSQGDVRDVLHLRQNLLRTVLAFFNWKERFIFNERVVVLLPAAVSALCTGFPSFPHCERGAYSSYFVVDVPEAADDCGKADEYEQRNFHKPFECSSDVLAQIDPCSGDEVPQPQSYQNVHVPPQLRDPLLHEMETCILEAILNGEIEKTHLSDVVFVCALISNFMYSSYITRQRDSLFLSKTGRYMLELTDCAASIVEKFSSDIACGFSASNFTFDCTDSMVASFRSFVGSPIFSKWRDQNVIGDVPYTTIIQSIERLLKGLAKLYEGFSDCSKILLSEIKLPDYSASMISVQDSYLLNSSKSMIVDMDLDASADVEDADILTVSGKSPGGLSVSSVNRKLDILSLISCFFSVLPIVTWDILFNIMEKESDPRVVENLLLSLCQHLQWSSCRKFSDLVMSINDMVDIRTNLKLQCFNIQAAICCLLETLLSSSTIGDDKDGNQSLKKIVPEQRLKSLGDLVNKVAQNDLLGWFGRIKLIDCICDFILLEPHIGQTMIDKLLMMLQDPDYRVRLSLAKRIGILFQTWDGHDDLFQDICSSFGVKLVVSSKGKLVTAKEVLATGPHPRPLMETIIITLMHLALHSEKLELEAVFMMCVVAAIDPCQRELVGRVLDNLSRKLQYATRSKYMEELMGPILFFWVACGVSLAALVETRDLFVLNVEPSNFVQYCCHWLLPALILHGDISNLNWVAKIACQTSAALVQNYFVPIFSVCMALHCSKQSGSENGAAVLQCSILSIAKITENERDMLIKKHMVSIVSHILSLASCASNPALPFFSRDTVVQAIQTIVDGFLEMEHCPRSAGVLDKINIFRPDRVFMFIVEMHYKVTAAIHYRHKCNRLAAIEVLINVLGHRAAVSSTSNYLFNLVGQLIGCHALQDQCCSIISTLLKFFRTNPSKETIGVLGEQLQFLVSKLIACCIPSKSNGEISITPSSQVLSLLQQLTVDSDPSLHDHIRELEPFPKVDTFDAIRKFHEQLCKDYSPRDHLIKFARRSCYLPPRFLLSSLRALHNKLFLGYSREKNAEDIFGDAYWDSDREIVNAVWTLVPMCNIDDADSFGALVSDFISRVGIGDPHRVVFHHPGESNHIHVSRPLNSDSDSEMSFQMGTGISEELLVAVMTLLKKYLMDDSVQIIDLTSHVLRGILSTERGQQALASFDSYERSLIEVHCKGVNLELVQNSLLDLERKFNAKAISVEMSGLWETCDKTFETWICPLVYALIGYCDDIVLRLCQDIVFMKAEVAELLLPNVFVNLAGRKDLDIDICKLISLKLQENIFSESNKLIKSIQISLEALNELRLCRVMERTASSSMSSKRESSKYAKPSSYNSRSRSTLKLKNASSTSAEVLTSTSSWEKVYWLPVDYLIVSKSAIRCGSYFTAVLYVEHWSEEHFSSLTLGSPDFSHLETLPHHIEILVSAFTQINEPDSLYGIIQSHKLTSQIITFEHEGNWSKALEYYDLQVRSEPELHIGGCSRKSPPENSQPADCISLLKSEDGMRERKPYKGLIRSLQQIGCTHVLDLYCQGLTSRKGRFQHDLEFNELQYEAAWRAGNWDFSLLCGRVNSPTSTQHIKSDYFNENLHSCLRALQGGDSTEFHLKLKDSKQELLFSIHHASKESTEYIYSTVIKLQIFYYLGMAWGVRWKTSLCEEMHSSSEMQKLSEPIVPTVNQLSWLNKEWSCILKRAQLHMNLLEPFIAFRRVLLQILGSMDCSVQHLLESASTLRKGSRFSQAAAALHEFKFHCTGTEEHSKLYWLGRVEEAKLLRAQGQHEMAINLAKYISQNYQLNEEASDVYRLVGKWLAETRSSNSRTILEKYLKHAVTLAEDHKAIDKKFVARQSQTHFHLAHYADALFRSSEERLNSNEWQAAMRLRKHKTKELEALIRQLKSSSKGEKIDYSVKIQELQKQLAMDREEAEKLQQDRDNFLNIALEGYKRCLVIGDKYDVRVVFRLVSLWFSLSTRQIVVNNMLITIEEVQSYKFIPLVYQIASRMGSSKDGQGPRSFQFALVSLVKKMAIDHPYHTIFQLLALANGDRVKDKQRSRNSFVVDMDKKYAAENLLQELTAYHGAVIRQMKQIVEIYIKLAELEVKREDMTKKITLPREIRSVRQLELVPVVTATFPVDRSCEYHEGSFPHFKGLGDSITVMNGVNAPKVIECLGSDGSKYRQLAKSGNDDLRQDAVMEQFFALVNTFLQNHRDTWKRRLGIRTYKVVPFTPSAGVLEWVNGTIPLGDYLIGSTRNGGAHGCYGVGDWTFLKCRQHMAAETKKREAFQEVCQNFRPVMHYFFLERFLNPADWFEKRLAYTRSVAASSMVGYIVGLGDRHSMNILIDQATAEVVHIDLGVAFEQGLMLKTRERVPFRLTRDIIDGMGVTGVEGIFRRCCEETLSVMRTNKEALLTIIEVFIHDPLYKWALSPLKALQRQKEIDDDLDTSLEDSQDEYEGNKDAARALLRVKQKLDGYEEGEMRSVHGQVQQLIQDAIDPDRLCQMFPGWGAWL